MRKVIRRVVRLVTSLPILVGIGACLLAYYFASIQQYCEWMSCTIYYNWDKPLVVFSFVLSVLLLGQAAFEITRSLLKKEPSQQGTEMPTPLDDKDLKQHCLRTPINDQNDLPSCG